MWMHGWISLVRVCVFAFLLIEISSRKAVPEVTSTFPGPLHKAANELGRFFCDSIFYFIFLKVDQHG